MSACSEETILNQGIEAPLEMENDKAYDPPMTQEQEGIISKLTSNDLKKIDNILISQASTQWRKLARIIGYTMLELEKEYPKVPDVFYTQRVMLLVDSKVLESQGNLKRMRYSEVRLLN